MSNTAEAIPSRAVNSTKLSREQRNAKRNARQAENAEKRTKKSEAYAPVVDARAQYHDVFVKAKNDTDPTVVIARQKYRAAFQTYKQFIFQTEGLDAVERAIGAESWKARPYLSIAGKHITPEQMTATVAVGSIAVPAVAAAPLAAAFHLGGTSLYAMVAAGAGFGVASHLAIKPVKKSIREEYATTELAARQAGQTIEDFKKENIELLGNRTKSIKNRRVARLLASLGFTTATVVTTGMLTSDHVGHSAGQWASKGVDAGLHSIGLEQGWADYLANGTGAFQTFIQKFGVATGVVWQELFGAKSAMAAELPVTSNDTHTSLAPTESPYVVGEVLRVESEPDVVSRLGSAPFADSRIEAFDDAHIQSAADGAVRGGMRPEFKDEFIAALYAQRGIANPEMIQIGPRQGGEWMLGSNGSVLGVGEKDFLLDTSRVPVPGARTAIVTYPAERFYFTAEDSEGVLHRITILRADECNNFMQVGDEIISRPTPPPVESAVVVPPPVEVAPPPRPPTEVYLRREPIICVPRPGGGSCDVPTNAHLIFDERGMSLADAQERVRDLVLGEDRRGTESILIPNFQGNIPPELRFVLMHYTDPVTGRTSYWCMSIENTPGGHRAGHFSHPYIESPSGRSIQVRSEAQWQELINGPGNVVNPDDPTIPLVLVDTNNNGVPDVLRVRREDLPTTVPARQ